MIKIERHIQYLLAVEWKPNSFFNKMSYANELFVWRDIASEWHCIDFNINN